MVFSSLVFICLFLPLTVGLYYATPGRYRNITLLAASLVFYSWGAPRFVAVLILSSLADFVLARQIEQRSALGDRQRLLAVGVVLNVGVLCIFKYANFAVEQVAVLWGGNGPPTGWIAIALPIGISFFTFQKLSYLIDVYRGTVRSASSFTAYLLYVSL
ncbi:MAG: MBOAT family protein, partial [Myxococcota bacterium]